MSRACHAAAWLIADMADRNATISQARSSPARLADERCGPKGQRSAYCRWCRPRSCSGGRRDSSGCYATWSQPPQPPRRPPTLRYYLASGSLGAARHRSLGSGGVAPTTQPACRYILPAEEEVLVQPTGMVIHSAPCREPGRLRQPTRGCAPLRLPGSWRLAVAAWPGRPGSGV